MSDLTQQQVISPVFVSDTGCDTKDNLLTTSIQPDVLDFPIKVEFTETPSVVGETSPVREFPVKERLSPDHTVLPAPVSSDTVQPTLPINDSILSDSGVDLDQSLDSIDTKHYGSPQSGKVTSNPPVVPTPASGSLDVAPPQPFEVTLPEVTLPIMTTPATSKVRDTSPYNKVPVQI